MKCVGPSNSTHTPISGSIISTEYPRPGTTVSSSTFKSISSRAIPACTLAYTNASRRTEMPQDTHTQIHTHTHKHNHIHTHSADKSLSKSPKRQNLQSKLNTVVYVHARARAHTHTYTHIHPLREGTSSVGAKEAGATQRRTRTERLTSKLQLGFRLGLKSCACAGKDLGAFTLQRTKAPRQHTPSALRFPRRGDGGGRQGRRRKGV